MQVTQKRNKLVIQVNLPEPEIFTGRNFWESSTEIDGKPATIVLNIYTEDPAKEVEEDVPDLDADEYPNPGGAAIGSEMTRSTRRPPRWRARSKQS